MSKFETGQSISSFVPNGKNNFFVSSRGVEMAEIQTTVMQCEVVGCFRDGNNFDESSPEEDVLYLCDEHEKLVVVDNYDVADYPYDDAPANVLVVKRKSAAPVETVVVVTASAKRERPAVEEDDNAEAESALKEQMLQEDADNHEKKPLAV
jgi:hypothetical protein